MLEGLGEQPVLGLEVVEDQRRAAPERRRDVCDAQPREAAATHLEDRRVLGVHIVGEGATELIHIGQAVIAHNGSLDFFVDAVFNYPTLAETYKIAALDAWNKL